MNRLILATNIILGSILIYSYYYLSSKNEGAVEKLWGNITQLDQASQRYLC